MNAVQVRAEDKKEPANPSQTAKQSQYMVQLDSLRAFAVFAVMYFHFYWGGHGGTNLPLAAWGVQLFFVLSGFLITGILLKCRNPDDNDTQNGRFYSLRQFYIRRSLRIFPLYYLVLFITALLNIHPVRETLLWHMTYTSNVYFGLHGWNGPVSHFWSLSVEEQFYLLWPLLMLFLPDKYLLPCIITAIIIAPLYQTVGFLVGTSPIMLSTITIAWLDSLGMGALLALYRYKKPFQFDELGRHRVYKGLGFLLLLVMFAITLTGPHLFWIVVVNKFIGATVFAWIIHQASIGCEGAVGHLLELKPLVYCGKISYGLYVYHNFMPVLIPGIFRRLHLPFAQNAGMQFVVLSLASILIATLSWFLFEQPINNMKRRFEYVK